MVMEPSSSGNAYLTLLVTSSLFMSSNGMAPNNWIYLRMINPVNSS